MENWIDLSITIAFMLYFTARLKKMERKKRWGSAALNAAMVLVMSIILIAIVIKITAP